MMACTDFGQKKRGSFGLRLFVSLRDLSHLVYHEDARGRGPIFSLTYVQLRTAKCSNRNIRGNVPAGISVEYRSAFNRSVKKGRLEWKEITHFFPEVPMATAMATEAAAALTAEELRKMDA